MTGFKVRLTAILRLCVVIGLISLLGRYFGGMWMVARVAVLVVPVLSIAYAGVSLARLKFEQSFSNDHPPKGGVVEYELSITNESPLPSCTINLEIYLGSTASPMDRRREMLRPNRRTVIARSIRCPFRGVYEVGLSRFSVTDALGIVELFAPVFHRTFYVTPRVLEMPPGIIRLAREHVGSEKMQFDGGDDTTLFREMSEYRDGDDARRIAWTYYASRGTLLVRRFDSGVEPGVRVVLDTRCTDSVEANLRVEDCSIEIVVAVVRAAILSRVPVTLCGHGIQWRRFDPGELDRLLEFVRETVGLFFHSGASPAALTTPRDGLGNAPYIFVTHVEDSALVERLATGPIGESAVIFNSGGLSADRARALGKFAKRMRNQGRVCWVVNSADELLGVDRTSADALGRMDRSV